MPQQPAHDPFGRPTTDTDQPDPSDSAGPSGTGDGPEATAALASRWARLGAWVTDVILVSAPVYFTLDVLRPTDWVDDADDTTVLLVTGGVTLLLIVALFVYSVALLSRSGARNGQTLGKQIVGTRVVHKDGRPLTLGRAAQRELARGLLALVPLLGLADTLTIFFSDHRRTLHDMLGSTVVIEAGAPTGAPVASAPEDSAYAQPAGWYPDPSGTNDLRWWDGSAWGEATASAPDGAADASRATAAASPSASASTTGSTAAAMTPATPAARPAPARAAGAIASSPAAGSTLVPDPAPLEAPLASRGRRFAARLFDTVVVGGPLFVVWLLADSLLSDDSGYWEDDSSAWIFLLVTIAVAVAFVLYMTLMLCRKGSGNGQTWGKQLLGVRVTRATGAPLNGGDAFLREVLCFQVLGLFPFYWLADGIAAFCNPRRQALHDLMVSTVVLDTSGGPKTVALGGSPYLAATATGPSARAADPRFATKPAGWYPDPSAAGDVRWWDGSAWTDHTRADRD